MMNPNKLSNQEPKYFLFKCVFVTSLYSKDDNKGFKDCCEHSHSCIL